MNEVEKALELIKEFGPRVVEAVGIIGSLATAAKVIEASITGEEISEDLKAEVDAAYLVAFQKLMDTE